MLMVVRTSAFHLNLKASKLTPYPRNQGMKSTFRFVRHERARKPRPVSGGWA